MNDDGESYPAVVSSYGILGDVTEIKVLLISLRIKLLILLINILSIL